MHVRLTHKRGWTYITCARENSGLSFCLTKIMKKKEKRKNTRKKWNIALSIIFCKITTLASLHGKNIMNSFFFVFLFLLYLKHGDCRRWISPMTSPRFFKLYFKCL